MPGESLIAVKESDNIHDRNAMALLGGDMKVGHVPMKISGLCSSFITRGGTIEALVSESRQYAADLPQERCSSSHSVSHILSQLLLI